MGSPPRVREKRIVKHSYVKFFGITPACAGKTFIEDSAFNCIQDHPRVCGKNGVHVNESLTFSGSPPRVREKLNSIYGMTVTDRITPACAGKTETLFLSKVEKWDHPRVCGKN